MRKLILFLICCIQVIILSAQAPESFQYQTIIRNDKGEIIANSSIGVRISILSENIFGAAVFVETHTLSTNRQGLITLAIGEGDPVIGSISQINWGEESFFLKVELDNTGGINYTTLGVNQLLSVPYAFHAKTAGNVFSGNYQDLTNKPDFNDWDMNQADDFDGNYSSLVGAPKNISDFINDAGYVSANDFTGWDQDASDDFSGDFNDLTNIPPGLLDGDDNTQLSESQVETYITNGPIDLAEGSTVNGKLINDWNSLQNIPADIADGDDVLTEAQVDAFVSNNGYLTSEIDGDITNELQNLDQVLTLGNDAGGKRITNLGKPENSTDVATKEYIDLLLNQIELIEAQLEDGYLTDSGYFTDQRDGNNFKWVKIGKQIWMAENLAWLPSVSLSSTGSDVSPVYYVYDYEGTDVLAAKITDNYVNYGVLYNWHAAKSACPAGWHLPTDVEWEQLAEYISIDNGGYTKVGINWYSVGGHIKASSGWKDNRNGTDDYCFKAIPGGYRFTSDYFGNLGEGTGWWSSTSFSDIHGTSAWTRSLFYQTSNLTRSENLLEFGFSVRCLKDK